MLIDRTSEYLKAALSGLGVQRQAHLDNLANLETPGYRARRVAFESALARAADHGDLTALDATVTRSTAPTNQNGNNVAPDEEMVALTENALRQQLAVEALNARYRLLRTAIGVE